MSEFPYKAHYCGPLSGPREIFADLLDTVTGLSLDNDMSNTLTAEQKATMTGDEIAAWNTANNAWTHTVPARKAPRRKPAVAYFAPAIHVYVGPKP